VGSNVAHNLTQSSLFVKCIVALAAAQDGGAAAAQGHADQATTHAEAALNHLQQAN